MPTGVYKRKPNTRSGKYIRTDAIRKKLSDSIRKNPTKYWLGKNIPPEVIQKIKDTKKRNGKKGNSDYFKRHRFLGINHKLWKGDRVGYDALHSWLYRKLGSPNICEHCKKIELNSRKIHWANKSGKYRRELSDWLRLCAKCHYHYDRY